MTDFETHILLCVHADLVELRKDYDSRDLVRGEHYQRQEDQRNARERRWVPLDLRRWCGGKTPTAADRKRYQRSCDKLQVQGLLHRVAAGQWSGNRTTHIELTPAGELAAEQLKMEVQECQRNH